MKIDRWVANRRVTVMSSGANDISRIEAIIGWTTDRVPFKELGVYRIEVNLGNGRLITPPANRVHYVKYCV